MEHDYDSILIDDPLQLVVEIRCKDKKTYGVRHVFQSNTGLYRDITEEFGKPPEYLDLSLFTSNIVRYSLMISEINEDKSKLYDILHKLPMKSKIDIMNCMKYLQISKEIIVEGFIDSVMSDSFKGGYKFVNLYCLEKFTGVKINYPETIDLEERLRAFPTSFSDDKFFFDMYPQILETYEEIDELYDRIATPLNLELDAGKLNLDDFIVYHGKYSHYIDIVKNWIKSHKYDVKNDASLDELCTHFNFSAEDRNRFIREVKWKHW